MPTIYDVAKKAGVAPVTVSRVINNSGYVSPKTRAKVEKAIAELNYSPNHLARGLRSKETHSIGLIVTDITNPFWTTVARGVEDTAQAHDFSVILCNTDEDPEKQDRYIRVLMQKQVDGFVFVPAQSDTAPIELMQDNNVPVVVMDRKIPMDIDTVRCDSEGGAYKLTQHLLSLGHRHIALLGGAETVSTATERAKGYEMALEQAGILVDPAYIFNDAFTLEAGYKMTKQALALDPRPTALFAVNNFIAIGAYKALRDMNLTAPDDIALVAFDDLPPALVMEPFLTVASQPAYEMGEQATKLLIQRLSSDGDGAVQDIILPTSLIVRQSSQKIA